MRTMEARGTTDLAGGLRLGLLEVASHHTNEGINRVVLLSDGVPNDRAPLDAMARSAAQNGITITTLGLGTDYDETVMAHLAQHSGGRFQYVQDSAQVAAMFRDEVLRMQRVVGRNAVAVLTEWDEFKDLDYQKIHDGMLKPAFLFDGRNILPHAKLREIGFRLFAIGKPY